MRSKKNVCFVKRIRKSLQKRELYKDERGMSLVEVIVAITILGLVAVPVLHSLTTSMVYNAKARNRQEMTLTAESIMETFKGYDLETLKARFSSGGIGIEGVSVAVAGVDAEYDPDPDTGSGFHYTYSSAPLAETVGDTYTFSINEMKAENGQFYDVTITAAPNSVEKVMEPVNMETTRDAIYIGDQIFDTNVLDKAQRDFENNHQSDLADYFRDSHPDAVIKKNNNIITIKDEISELFADDAFSVYKATNYIKLYERRIEFHITKNSSDEYVVTPKMYYSYRMEKYPYYVRGESGSLPEDKYDGSKPGSVASVEKKEDEDLNYPDDGSYLEVEIDLDSTCQGGASKDDNVTDGYIYKNPVTAKLDRLYVYYYPRYDVKDKLIVKNLAGIVDFQCYLLKQRPADTRGLETKEHTYTPDIELENSASGFKIFHNFEDNIGKDEKSYMPRTLSIAGATGGTYSYAKKSKDNPTEVEAYFSKNEVLSYKLELVVTQNGRTVTRLESSMNEKIK